MYRYPDCEDRISLTYQLLNEPYPGYWERSETYAFDIAHACVLRKETASVLDVGCGRGRLLPHLARTYRDVMAIEPDEGRMHAAKSLAQALPNVRVIHSDLLSAELNRGAFDVAVCSHVLQHVDAHTAQLIIEKIHWALKPHGIIIIAVPRSHSASDLWITSSLTGDNVTATRVCESEFNTLLTNNLKVLPIRLFADRTVMQMLARRFDLLRIWRYSYMGEVNIVDRLIFRDRLFNLPFFPNSKGDNMIVAARAHE